MRNVASCGPPTKTFEAVGIPAANLRDRTRINDAFEDNREQLVLVAVQLLDLFATAASRVTFTDVFIVRKLYALVDHDAVAIGRLADDTRSFLLNTIATPATGAAVVSVLVPDVATLARIRWPHDNEDATDALVHRYAHRIVQGAASVPEHIASRFAQQVL